MGVLNGFLLVLFIIIAILLILLVLAQNEEGDTMGGVFAGGSNTAFGSRSGNILTKASSVLGVLFFVLAFSIALLNRSPGDSGVEAAGRETSGGSDWFMEDSSSAPQAPGISETPVPSPLGLNTEPETANAADAAADAADAAAVPAAAPAANQ